MPRLSGLSSVTLTLLLPNCVNLCFVRLTIVKTKAEVPDAHALSRPLEPGISRSSLLKKIFPRYEGQSVLFWYKEISRSQAASWSASYRKFASGTLTTWPRCFLLLFYLYTARVLGDLSAIYSSAPRTHEAYFKQWNLWQTADVLH